MKNRRISGRRREDATSFDLPTSLLVALIVMATLVVVHLFTTL